MIARRLTVVLVAALTFAVVAHSALRPIDAVSPVDDASVAVFKSTPEADLKMYLYFPGDWRAADRRSAIVFFFAGGCTSGSAAQFASKARYFASRGMVAAAAEYRIADLHHTGPRECIEDAKSAVRWLRANARSLGIDTRRVVAAGGSSGGTAAALTAYGTGDEPADEDHSVSSTPDALVLINPALALPASASNPTAGQAALRDVIAGWKVAKDGPPAILFYGTEDELLPGGRSFLRAMSSAGNRAELYTAAGQKHGFSNDGNGSPWHAVVLRQSDLFLSSLGFLDGQPSIDTDSGAMLTRE